MLKATELPNGRCAFLSYDCSYCMLCYFRDGVQQKGPWLSIDEKTETCLMIRSQTPTIKGNQYYMTAEIRVGAKGSSSLFRDDQLVGKVDYIEKWLFDWVLPQLPEYINQEERPIKLFLARRSDDRTKITKFINFLFQNLSLNNEYTQTFTMGEIW